MKHSVSFTKPCHESMIEIDAWCTTHVGARKEAWNKTIVQIQHGTHAYVWVYTFHNAEAATEFALVWS